MHLIRATEWDQNYCRWYSSPRIFVFETNEEFGKWLADLYANAQYHIWWNNCKWPNIDPLQVKIRPDNWDELCKVLAEGLTLKGTEYGTYRWADDHKGTWQNVEMMVQHMFGPANRYQELAKPRHEEIEKAQRKLYLELKAKFE